MTPIARTASAADSETLPDFLAKELETISASRAPNTVTIELVAASELRTLQATNTALQRELAELKATNAGLEKDAARYRWLRERHRNPYIQLNVPPYGTGIISGTECNEVIDAALATSAGERKGEVE
jgi:hypothetical protein